MKTKLLLILGLIALPIATTIAWEHRDTPGGIQNIDLHIKNNPALTKKVTDKLEADDILKKYIKFERISIKSYMNGHVKLTGQVEKETEKQRATELTKEVEGVTDVTNNILINRSLLK